MAAGVRRGGNSDHRPVIIADAHPDGDAKNVEKEPGRRRGQCRPEGIEVSHGASVAEEQVRNKPKKVMREYIAHWENELDANGKPWTWRDVSRVIGFQRYKSMLRVFIMMGEVERYLRAGEADKAHAQVIQSMECVSSMPTDRGRLPGL